MIDIEIAYCVQIQLKQSEGNASPQSWKLRQRTHHRKLQGQVWYYWLWLWYLKVVGTYKIYIQSNVRLGPWLSKVSFAIDIIHLWRDFGVYRCVGTRSYDNYLGRPSYGSSYGRGYDRTESVYMEVPFFSEWKSNSISSL